MKSNAYWEGYLAAEAGKERHCSDPWSAQWLLEWFSGYDAFKASNRAQHMQTQEKLARFGHHPDPATDFCVEVEVIEGEVYDASVGMADADKVRDRISRALDFRVGGDVIAINAKATLRDLAAKVGPYRI